MVLEGASKRVLLTETLHSFITLVNAGNHFQRLNS